VFEITGHKYHSFAALPGDRWLIAGTSAGQLCLIDIEKFRLIRELDFVGGEIEAIAVHPRLPHILVLSADHFVTIYRYENDGSLARLVVVPLRKIKDPDVEAPAAAGPSLSEALDCHPTEARFLTRTAEGAITEVSYGEGQWRSLWVSHCLHDDGFVIDPFYVRYLVNSTDILATSSHGQLVILDPNSPKEPKLYWEVGTSEAIHNAQHVEGTEYLLSCDSRMVIRFDVSGKKKPVIGPRITRDHLEWVYREPVSGRFFITSWDKTVQEIDPVTCESRRVLFRSHYKIRWIWTSSHGPSTAVLQTRDGMLLKVDLETGQRKATIRDTPNALWSGVFVAPNRLIIAGEDRRMLEANLSGDGADTRAACEWVDVESDPETYCKRMVLHPPSGNLLQGRSDGKVILFSPKSRQSRTLVSLGSSVRDMASAPQGNSVFVSCDDGSLHLIDAEAGTVRATYRSPRNEPLWSLAHNAKHGIVAVGERDGLISLLSAEDLSLVKSFDHIDEAVGCTPRISRTLRPKRLRWFDDETLIATLRNRLIRIDRTTEKAKAIFAEHNTLEDFDWDEEKRYLAAICYDRTVVLVSLFDDTVLSRVYVDVDYPKGVLFLSPRRHERAYPHELVVFGRTGYAYKYIVSNDRLFPDGRLNDTRTWLREGAPR
jgi:WD40 repeat protein